jgi:hypothetical protein
LRVPNAEVMEAFLSVLGSASEVEMGGPFVPVSRALVAGDVEALQAALTDVMVRALSYHDIAPGSPAVPVESVYHAFILGLLLHLGPPRGGDDGLEASGVVSDFVNLLDVGGQGSDRRTTLMRRCLRLGAPRQTETCELRPTTRSSFRTRPLR